MHQYKNSTQKPCFINEQIITTKKFYADIFPFRSQAAKPMQTALPTLAKRCPELLSMLLAPKPSYWQLMTFPLTQLMMKTALQKISKDLFKRRSYTGKNIFRVPTKLAVFDLAGTPGFEIERSFGQWTSNIWFEQNKRENSRMLVRTVHYYIQCRCLILPALSCFSVYPTQSAPAGHKWCA